MKLIQRTVRILFILIISIAFGIITVKASDRISFSVNNINDVEKGSNITVVVQARNLENASQKPIGIKLDLFYDSDVLEYVSAEKGNDAGSAIALHENYTEEGRIRIGLVSFLEMNKSGEFYTVQFKVKDNANVTTSELKLELSEVSDSSGNQIECDVQNATISFKGVVADSEKQENTQNESAGTDNSEKNSENAEESNTENGSASDNKGENNANEDSQDANSEENEQSNDTIQKIAITEQNKNITSLLKGDSSLDTETELTYEVENPEILEIDKQGNIVPKEKGTTKVTVRDGNNQEEVITIEVGEESASLEASAEGVEEELNNNTILFILLGVIIAIIIVISIVLIVRKKRK